MKYDIEDLIPQRAPIKMVDNLLEVGSRKIVSEFSIREDNYFAENGEMAEAGLIEHMAQTASALSGYLSAIRGGSQPPMGYIAEIKDFNCLRCPRVGERLQTLITMGEPIGNFSIIQGETRINEEIVATTQMKIFIRPTN